MTLRPFQLPFGNYQLRGDRYAPRCNTLILHGAGKSSRARFGRLRQALDSRGLPSASFDFIGHGETGGDLLDSSLRHRTDQAAAVIRHACSAPLTLMGASMSGYTAIKLTEAFAVDNLTLLVPAVYTPRAYEVGFGPRFSAVIRSPGSWRDSDAFATLSRFRGKLLIIAAESDHVIPRQLIERLYRCARNARSRRLHIVPGSTHLSLFPTRRDFLVALELILRVCTGQS